MSGGPLGQLSSGLGQLSSLPIANSSSVVMTMVNGDDEYYNGDNVTRMETLLNVMRMLSHPH